MQQTLKVDPLAHSPDGAAQQLGISTRAVYDKIASGELSSYKDGKRRLIPTAELQRYVDRKIAEAAKA